jgi:prolipoprotein diacylglyceryltransferase
MVGVAYLLIYPLGRFSLEFLRGDQRMRWAGLSVAQWVSMALFAGGLVLWGVLRRRAQESA